MSFWRPARRSCIYGVVVHATGATTQITCQPKQVMLSVRAVVAMGQLVRVNRNLCLIILNTSPPRGGPLLSFALGRGPIANNRLTSVTRAV